MAIIGTLPPQFIDKKQQLPKAPRYEHAHKNIYISAQGKSIGNIQNMRRLKGCIGLHRNNLTKTGKKW